MSESIMQVFAVIGMLTVACTVVCGVLIGFNYRANRDNPDANESAPFKHVGPVYVECVDPNVKVYTRYLNDEDSRAAVPLPFGDRWYPHNGTQVQIEWSER